MEAERETLIKVILNGNSKNFLGKVYTTHDIEEMEDEKVGKLFDRYSISYTSMMTSGLKSNFLHGFTSVLNYFIPFEREKVYNTLNEDPLLDLWLSEVTSSIYQSIGTFVIPLSTAGKILPIIYNHARIDRGETEKPTESESGSSKCEEETRKEDSEQS